MGFEDQVEQSFGRTCRQSQSGPSGPLRTHLVHRGISFHCSVELEFSTIGFDPARFHAAVACSRSQGGRPSTSALSRGLRGPQLASCTVTRLCCCGCLDDCVFCPTRRTLLMPIRPLTILGAVIALLAISTRPGTGEVNRSSPRPHRLRCAPSRRRLRHLPWAAIARARISRSLIFWKAAGVDIRKTTLEVRRSCGQCRRGNSHSADRPPP
jgi:hypothetical protein